MTLQYAPRYDLDGFEILPAAAAGEAATATGGVGAATFLLAGAVAVGALKGWISKTSWSAAEYNLWMRQMNDTISQWDTLGWKLGCWQKYPAMRTNWLQYWTRFSKHFKEHPVVSSSAIVTWATESEEGPARILMAELATWGDWFNANCGAHLNVKPLTDAEASAVAKAQLASDTDWTSMLKWGAYGIGGLVVLNILTSLRGFLPSKR